MVKSSEAPQGGPTKKNLKISDIGKKPTDMLGLGYVGDKLRTKPLTTPAQRDAETALTDAEAGKNMATIQSRPGEVGTAKPFKGNEVKTDERDDDPRKHST